jgi:hypothetical protein
MATLTGPATEIVLYMSGRRSTAQVILGGNPDAIAVVERTKLRV